MSKSSNMKLDILAFGAHPDDIELSCGGTIISHVKKGMKVGLIDFTRGELGTRGNGKLRIEEAKKSADILGVEFRENLNMEDGFFEYSKENILKIAEQIRQYHPDIILANALHDRHPDHSRAAQMVNEATFLSGLKKVEIISDGRSLPAWKTAAVYHYIQDYYINPDIIVDISDYMKEKFAAILAFSSQFYNENSTEPETPISTPEFLDIVKHRCVEVGRLAGVKYGEGFTIKRPPAVRSLKDLI